ncbi:MAG: NAD(P)/FAD-dependent oxidoreductase [Chloroflexota bacterium]
MESLEFTVNTDQLSYDVIIVGGRPAGSTLAVRLGRAGLRVLLLERATLPSLPAVSSPIIYASSMKLLDEIGADERLYAHNTPRIQTVSAHGHAFEVDFPLPDSDGRDYAYAVDRARFDATLWDLAASLPQVTAYQTFNVTDLLWDGDRVCGVTGIDADRQQRAFRARLIIGADGRYSLVARKVKAVVVDEHDAFPTSLLYAYWRDVRPYKPDGCAVSVAYEGAPGLGYLLMDSADGTTAVVIEGRSDQLEAGPGQAEAFYMATLRENSAVWDRVKSAEMVTDVRGIRRVGNFYRQAGGPGWALVGDAYHQKDPLDGQGIYNALFTAKALAWAIRYWQQGEMDWDQAIEWYDETARIKTYAMYRSLLGRVQMSFYPRVTPPEWVQNTLGRWLMEDPAMHQLLGRFITRQIPPEMMTLMTGPVMARAIMRGSLRDLRQRVRAALPF